MSRKVLTTMLLVVVALGWTACAAAAPPQATSASQPPAATAAPAADTYGGRETALANPAGLPDVANRMIIQRAQLSLIVADTETAANSIRNMVTTMGGYIADSNLFRDGEQLRGTLTIRVPANNLSSALDQLKSLATRVVQESLSGEDVTAEYTDLDSRLRNLEAAEKELLALLTEVRQKPNAKAQDILDVYQQITQIRGEIEQIKGRMQYLQNLTSLATVTVELIPDALSKPVVQPGWQPLVAVREASGQLIGALQGIVNGAIWLVIFVLPILIVALLPFVLLYLLVRWFQRRRRAAVSTTEAG